MAQLVAENAIAPASRTIRPLPGSGLWAKLKAGARHFLTMVGLMSPVGVLVDTPPDPPRKRKKGKPLYRVIEEPEWTSMARDKRKPNNAQPSPFMEGSKQFWGSYEHAEGYQKLVNNINGGVETQIWRWSNPLGLGTISHYESTGWPVYEVANSDLPKLGPGSRLKRFRGGARGR